MSFSNPLFFSISVAQSGLHMFSQLVDYTDTNVGSHITSNFYEVGNGDYLWYYSSFPYGFRGAVKFYDASNSGYLASVALNPESDFLPDVINDQHGSGNYNFNGSFEGANLLTLSVIDQFNNPVGSARVDVRASGTTSTIDLGYTNSSTGETVLNLDSGAYSIIVSKPQYATFINPYWINLTGDTTETIQGNMFVLAPVPNMQTTRIYAYLDDVSLVPSGEVVATVKPSGAVAFGDSTYLLRPGIGAQSDETGYVFFDLASSCGPLKLTCSLASLNIYFNVPASGTYSFSELTPL